MKIRHALAATLLIGTCCAWAEQPVERRAAADPSGEVEVSMVSGNLTIQGWDRNEVLLTGTLDDSVERLEFETSGKRTFIKVVHKGSNRWNHGDDGETELNIRVPKGSRLTADTVSADLNVQDVTGAQRLQTVSGDLSTIVGREDAEIRTVSGDLSVRGDGSPAVLSVTTVSGDAHVLRVAGEINASTVSGSLEIDAGPLTRGRLRTTSGDAHLSATLAPNARFDAETVSGEIEIQLAGQIDAQFDIKTFSGEIDNCFGPRARSSDKYGPGRELHFTEGKGSAQVRLSSLSGEIRLCTSR